MRDNTLLFTFDVQFQDDSNETTLLKGKCEILVYEDKIMNVDIH